MPRTESRSKLTRTLAKQARKAAKAAERRLKRQGAIIEPTYSAKPVNPVNTKET